MTFDLQTLCITNRMYQKTDLKTSSEQISFADVLFTGGSIRLYCPSCKEESVFKIDKYLPFHPRRTTISYDEPDVSLNPFKSIVDDEYLKLIGKCAANEKHTAAFIFQITFDKVIKIGQYPSYADLSKPTSLKYKKVLGNDKFKEFNRAIGLASSEIGIGSFVYLRRIFEHILENSHNEAKTSNTWNEADYQSKKVHDKITYLKGFLPQFLVDNALLYSILSKGLHELSEEECISHFPVVKTGIELILDELLAKEEQKRKLAETQKAISYIHGKLKSK